MTSYELASVVISAGALLLSLVCSAAALAVAVYGLGYSRRQVDIAAKANALQQQVASGDVILHFTDRYFDLLKGREPINLISDPDWAYQYWRLQSTEFYFFQYGILPEFMFSLWMIDLGELYCGEKGPLARESHERYLKDYAFNYKDMTSFYSEVYRMACDYTDSATRNDKIVEFTKSWIKANRPKTRWQF